MSTLASPSDVPNSPEAEATAPHDSTFFTVPLAADSEDSDTVVLTSTDLRAAGIGPRTRWAAIVWGLLFAAIAAGTLAIVLVPARRLEFGEWFVSLEPATFGLYAALVVGTIVLLASLVGLLRRAQRTIMQRRLAS